MVATGERIDQLARGPQESDQAGWLISAKVART